MANNTDLVAKVIASSILLNEERQLLRVRDGAAPASTPKPQQVPAPVAHSNDARAVSAVLLTLLDERIQASADESVAEQGSFATPSGDGDDSLKAPARFGARYADNGAFSLADPQRPQAEINPAIVPNATLTSAPELQTFMQRLVAAAAQKSSGGTPATGFGSQLLTLGSSGVPLLAAGAAAALILWLGVIVAGWLFG